MANQVLPTQNSHFSTESQDTPSIQERLTSEIQQFDLDQVYKAITDKHDQEKLRLHQKIYTTEQENRALSMENTALISDKEQLIAQVCDIHPLS